MTTARAAEELDGLVEALTAVGRRVRSGVRGAAATQARRGSPRPGDGYAFLDRAERILRETMNMVGARWPGCLVLDGREEPAPVGGGGPWTYLASPLDGALAFAAGKQSAWVLLGVGRHARTLDELTASVVVEVPLPKAVLGLVASGRAGRLEAVDDDLSGRGLSAAVLLGARRGGALRDGFVSVMRAAPGAQQAIAAWQDAHLDGLAVLDDPGRSAGALLVGLAAGADAAVFDPRPVLAPGGAATYAPSLAGVVLARAAGALVERFPAGELDAPLDAVTPIAWAGYANAEVAARLRPG
ncbi:MAG: hypothetical protein ACKVWR_16600 [Acidimicrobiales bacterium]